MTCHLNGVRAQCRASSSITNFVVKSKHSVENVNFGAKDAHFNYSDLQIGRHGCLELKNEKNRSPIIVALKPFGRAVQSRSSLSQIPAVQRVDGQSYQPAKIEPKMAGSLHSCRRQATSTQSALIESLERRLLLTAAFGVSQISSLPNRSWEYGPADLTAYGNDVLFDATNPQTHRQTIWESDGTTSGTKPLPIHRHNAFRNRWRQLAIATSSVSRFSSCGPRPVVRLRDSRCSFCGIDRNHRTVNLEAPASRIPNRQPRSRSAFLITATNPAAGFTNCN